MNGKSDTLKVQMFGKFSLAYQGQEIRVGKKQTTKALQMLQALLYAGSAGLNRSQLLEYTFGVDLEKDLSNNLSVTVYYLRKLLKESGLPKECRIGIENGRYRFYAPCPVRVDVQLFQDYLRDAESHTDEGRLECLIKACRIYSGHFLPALAGEEWVTIEGARFQNLYSEALEEVCEMLKERREYDTILELCRHASLLYPFGEWQIWQMECLYAMHRVQEAKELYEKTEAMYYDELDVPPSERMTEFFQRMSSHVQLDVMDFDEIQKSLQEEAGLSGAYYCSYPSFVDSYHMAVRVMERSGQSIYLMLCTISDSRKKIAGHPERMKEVSDKLSEAIQEALRRGDFFTRYNASQFLVLLTGIRKEECPIAISRIDACFRQREASRQVEVTYRTASIAYVHVEESNLSFSN